MATKTKTRNAEQLASANFDALNARDFDAWSDLWAEDAIEDVIVLGILRGRDEILDFMRGLLAASPDYGFTVDRVISDGNFAVVQWRGAGNFTGAAFQGIDPTGKHIETRGVDIFEIEGDKIVRNTVYYDGASFARQVGMLPDQDSGAEKAMVAAFNALTKAKNAIDSRRRPAT
jgi:steroid delta-isomerase-like uncharacterized protein